MNTEETFKRYEKLIQEYEIIVNQINTLLLVKQQMEEDIEMLELSMMYQSNKGDRWNV